MLSEPGYWHDYTLSNVQTLGKIKCKVKFTEYPNFTSN